MRRVGSDLHGVFVTVMLLFEDIRSRLALLNKTLRRAPTEIYNTRNSCFAVDVHHVEYILDDIEHEVVLLLKSRSGNTHGDTAIGNRGAEDRHAGFISRSQYSVFGGDLSQLAAQQMQELPR